MLFDSDIYSVCLLWTIFFFGWLAGEKSRGVKNQRVGENSGMMMMEKIIIEKTFLFFEKTGLTNKQTQFQWFTNQMMMMKQQQKSNDIYQMVHPYCKKKMKNQKKLFWC